jgi:hypothetical protein
LIQTSGIMNFHTCVKTGALSWECTGENGEKPNRFYRHGLFLKNDGTTDIRSFRCLCFAVTSPQTVRLKVRLGLVRDRFPQEPEIFYAETVCTTEGGSVRLPVAQFSLPVSQSFYLHYCRSVQIVSDHPVTVADVHFQLDAVVALTCGVLSKAAAGGETAEYALRLINCTAQPHKVCLSVKPYGWEAMRTSVEPEALDLGPQEEKSVSVRVFVPVRVAPGGFERQTVTAVPDGDGALAASLQLTTSRVLPSPCVLLDSGEIGRAREKIETTAWAAKAFQRWRKLAEEWEVPEVDPSKPYLFLSFNANQARGAACVYAVTGNVFFARKAVALLRRTADPEKGYPHLPKFTHQEMVHEGECFKNIAIAYDLILGSGLLTEQDRSGIESVFRTFMSLIDRELEKGEISNWTLAEAEGALCCACVLQDRERLERFLFGTGGIAEHLSRGVFSDGWWFEVSVGYNLLAAGLFSETAQIVRHFGIDFAHISVPASYAKSVNSAAPLRDGLCTEVWGPNTKNFRNIKMLWDSLLPFYDYRGVIFGINDSAEQRFEGAAHVPFDPRYDLAYYLYRDPAYAEQLGKLPEENRDPLFGKAKFPAEGADENGAPPEYSVSRYSDNAGVAVLRSQTPGRTQREQIQVGLKYGSHGGAHGHYDRGSITSLMRYGRSLYNPENVWYSYHTFMYKFYVQNSVTHNMVTVDLKQQNPSEAKRTLFHSGKMMQACALENCGKWCNPPYGGWPVDDDRTFEQRIWTEGRYVFIPAEHPAYSSRSGFTEDVLTRRLTLVTDDYVLVFDYARGEVEHNYDCLYHLQGLKSAEGVGAAVRHTARLSDDPLSSAQFITECDWYEPKDTVQLHFETAFGAKKNNGGSWLTKNRTDFNESGPLFTNLFLPDSDGGTVVTGFPPEFDKVNKQLWYWVTGDGKPLAEGKFGAWIFGRKTISADVGGVSKLTLRVRVRDVDFEKGFPQHAKNTVFWGDPHIVTEDGTVVFCCDLPRVTENVNEGYGVGRDYENGPVKLEAKPYEKAIPAEPADRSEDGEIEFDLTGLHAVRFETDIGGDYPVGDESNRRRTVSLRKTGKEARFVTLLEMYESSAQVVSANMEGGDFSVELTDGRRQTVHVENLESRDGSRLFVRLREFREGRFVREETAVSDD